MNDFPFFIPSRKNARNRVRYFTSRRSRNSRSCCCSSTCTVASQPCTASISPSSSPTGVSKDILSSATAPLLSLLAVRFARSTNSAQVLFGTTAVWARAATTRPSSTRDRLKNRSLAALYVQLRTSPCLVVEITSGDTSRWASCLLRVISWSIPSHEGCPTDERKEKRQTAVDETVANTCVNRVQAVTQHICHEHRTAALEAGVPRANAAKRIDNRGQPEAGGADERETAGDGA